MMIFMIWRKKLDGINSQKYFTAWDWIGNKKYTLYCGGAEMDG